MIISPLLRVSLRPQFCSWIKQTRNVRPIVKIGKEKFQLTLDVHQFAKDEIRVKARPEYVIIEGKQEKKTKTGCVVRQFVRKFKLPDGCNPRNMKSELSPDGCLTITAPRQTCEVNLPCETMIKISFKSKAEDEPSNIPSDIKPEEKKSS